MRSSIGFVTALSVLSGCTQNAASPSTGAPRRLTPLSVEASPATDVGALVDRDTGTSVRVTAPLTLSLTFPREVEVRYLKVFGGRAVSVESEAVDAPERWTQLAQTRPGSQRLAVVLEPLGEDASLAEIEVWGTGAGSAPR